MKFNEFTETVRDGLEVLFEPDNMEVAVTRVVKNNGLILTGINIRDRNSMITPTIYIDDFYREDIQKEEIHTVVLRIKDIFTERCTKVSSDNEIQNYMDFNWVKNRLIYTVVNQSMNEEYLEHVPYIPFHDLAIIFRCVFHKGENGMASSTVSEDDLKRWHTDTKTLYQLAERNTPRYFPPVIDRITAYLKARNCLPAFVEDEFSGECGELYVISNEMGLNGAGAMLYRGILDMCTELAGDSIYIMPSSIHECMFVEAGKVSEPKMLADIVKEANDSVLHRQDILSYNVYYYDRKKHMLTIVTV